MFKQKMLSLFAGATLLISGASVGNAAGIALDPQFERGAVLGTSAPFDLLTNPNGAQIFELIPGSGIITGGGPTANGQVTFTANQPIAPGFSFTLSGAGPLLIGSSDGTFATEVFMADTSAAGDQDLIEFLFTLTTNQGGLTDSDMVILSLVGDFGSDPLGSPSTLGSAATGGAFLTLTEVNAVPLPASVLLLLTSLGGLFVLRQRRSA